MSSRSSAVSSSLMSLPEVSRRTGIPMPTVLRLRRENAEAISSTGSGSQRYFSPEVLPTLQRLYEAEKAAGSTRQSTMFLSVPRRQIPSQQVHSTKRVKAVRKEPRKQIAASQDLDQALANRIEILEKRQKAMCQEIADLVDWLSLPAKGIAKWS